MAADLTKSDHDGSGTVGNCDLSNLEGSRMTEFDLKCFEDNMKSCKENLTWNRLTSRALTGPVCLSFWAITTSVSPANILAGSYKIIFPFSPPAIRTPERVSSDAVLWGLQINLWYLQDNVKNTWIKVMEKYFFHQPCSVFFWEVMLLSLPVGDLYWNFHWNMKQTDWMIVPYIR